MSKYTTGEMARLCGITVRTVQFYDTKELLPPTELSEGGRRLYSENDLQRLRMICLLKSLGLSLDSIKSILQSDAPEKILSTLLDEQARQVSDEIKKNQRLLKAIAAVKQSMGDVLHAPVNSSADIESIMDGKERLRKSRITLLIVGIIMDIVEVGTITLWVLKGVWLPFAVCVPIMCVIIWLLVKAMYKNMAYICPECGRRFMPKKSEFFFAAHTAKTRRLTCTECGHNGWCVETYSMEEGK